MIDLIFYEGLIFWFLMQKNRELIFFPTSFGAHVCMLFEGVFVKNALRCYMLVFTFYPCIYLKQNFYPNEKRAPRTPSPSYSMLKKTHLPTLKIEIS